MTGSPAVAGRLAQMAIGLLAADAGGDAVIASAARTADASAAEVEVSAVEVGRAGLRAEAALEEAHLARRTRVVVVAPAGLDGHARGAAVLARRTARRRA